MNNENLPKTKESYTRDCKNSFTSFVKNTFEMFYIKQVI